MPDEMDKSTIPTRKSGRGKRMTKEQRLQAQDLFLTTFALTANITSSCKKAKVDRKTFYKWLEHDITFSLSYKQAELAANDMLLAAAWTRGVSGVEEPVVSMGKQVYVDGKPLMKRVYSDTVLLRLMSARMPEFRDKSHVDVHTTTSTAQEMQAIHTAIAHALDSYPEAKIAVADALVQMEKTRGRR